MKDKNDLPTMSIVVDGQRISFEQHMKDMSGSGALYDRDIRELLKSWRNSDWVHASDYITPIATEVIIDCCEDDREMYNKIMTVIEEAYDKLYQQSNSDKPKLTRIK